MDAYDPPKHRSRRLRRMRSGILAALGALLVFGVAGALAIHDYTDVPDASPFHGDIAAIKRAGITGGKTCAPPGTPPTYCPGEPITREAMAAFVHRGFGRVAFQQGVETALGNAAYTDLATVVLESDGIPGGTGFVVLEADVTAIITSTAGCPCMAAFHLAGFGGLTSSQRYLTLDSLTSGGTVSGFGIESLSLSWVVPVDTAVDHLVTVRGRIAGGTGTIEAYADLTAQWVPFGSTGTDTLGAAPPPPGRSLARVTR